MIHNKIMKQNNHLTKPSRQMIHNHRMKPSQTRRNSLIMIQNLWKRSYLRMKLMRKTKLK